ncbi:unnamed protein product, partial [Choristocarpus tenellus]
MEAFYNLFDDRSTVTVNGTAYVKFGLIGKGGSSKVYRVLAPNHKV